MATSTERFGEKASDIVNVLTRFSDLEAERRVLYLSEFQVMVREQLAEAKVNLKAELAVLSPLSRRIRKMNHERWLKERAASHK